MRRALRACGLGVLLPATLALCGCGESKGDKEAKAQQTACAARMDIKAKIAHMQTLTPTIQSLPAIKTDVSSIAADLKKIEESAEALAPARKQEFRSATEKFEREASEAISKVGASGTLSGVATELGTALRDLARAYASALEPVSCS
jgi:hypothetical protein